MRYLALMLALTGCYTPTPVQAPRPNIIRVCAPPKGVRMAPWEWREALVIPAPADCQNVIEIDCTDPATDTEVETCDVY